MAARIRLLNVFELQSPAHDASTPTTTPPPGPAIDAKTAKMASPVQTEDQGRLLEDALTVVREQTRMMRRCLDTSGKLMDALKCWWVLQNVQ